MRKRKKIKKGQLFIGIFLIYIGTSFLIINSFKNCLIDKQENNMIQKYFENEKVIYDSNNDKEISNNVLTSQNEYVAVLEIPKINLRQGLFSLNNPNNNVNKNIEILKNSDMPNVNNGLLILASHSGSANISYFRHLHKLNLNDVVNLYYQNAKYIYEIISSERQEKSGNITFSKNNNETILILTTCDSLDKNKQIIIKAKLRNKLTY